MSEAERKEWDRRYADAEDHDHKQSSSPFLEIWLERLPRGGRALDLACGTGRNALRLAEAGYEVDAVDISTMAIAHGKAEAEKRGLIVSWQVADLDEFALEDAAYQLILVIRYRNHSLWPKIIDAMAPDGWVLVEHHFKTTAPVVGPSEAFKLEPQELLDALGSLRVALFEEVIGKDPDRPERTVALQRIVACKGNPGY